MEIVDFHAHVYPADRAGFWRRPSSVADLLSALDEAGVQSAGVIAIAPHIPNDVVAAAARAHPDRLVAIGSVDPRDPEAIAALETAVSTLRVRAIKVHPRLQSLTGNDIPALVRIGEKCGELGVPLVICSFDGAPTTTNVGVLELCGEIAGACPGTRVVLAHAGGHRPMDAFLLLKAHRNAMADLSFSPIYFAGSSAASDLEFLVRRSNPRQLLFGSDFPEAPIAASVQWMRETAERCRLPAADIEAIFAGNARTLLKI